MLQICEEYSVDFCIKSNASISKLLGFSNNSIDVNVNVKLQGKSNYKIRYYLV